MVRGTTPILTMQINSDIDFDDIKEIWVTVKDKFAELNYSLSDQLVTVDAENKIITVVMSQEDTLSLHEPNVNMQVRLLTNGNIAYASAIKTVLLSDILKEGVIE